jgi:hypothetical protein
MNIHTYIHIYMGQNVFKGVKSIILGKEISCFTLFSCLHVANDGWVVSKRWDEM